MRETKREKKSVYSYKNYSITFLCFSFKGTLRLLSLESVETTDILCTNGDSKDSPFPPFKNKHSSESGGDLYIL